MGDLWHGRIQDILIISDILSIGLLPREYIKRGRAGFGGASEAGQLSRSRLQDIPLVVL